MVVYSSRTNIMKLKTLLNKIKGKYTNYNQPLKAKNINTKLKTRQSIGQTDDDKKNRRPIGRTDVQTDKQTMIKD